MSLGYWELASQLVGAIAVIWSLIFVGRQIRESVEATRSATTHAVHELFVNAYVSFSQNPDATLVFLKGAYNFDKLTEQERPMFMAYAMAVFAALQSAFDQWRTGHLRRDLWQGWESLVHSNLKCPGIAAAWRIRAFAFSPEFQAHIERLLLRTDGPRASVLGMESPVQSMPEASQQ